MKLYQVLVSLGLSGVWCSCYYVHKPNNPPSLKVRKNFSNTCFDVALRKSGREKYTYADLHPLTRTTVKNLQPIHWNRVESGREVGWEVREQLGENSCVIVKLYIIRWHLHSHAVLRRNCFTFVTTYRHEGSTHLLLRRFLWHQDQDEHHLPRIHVPPPLTFMWMIEETAWKE